MNNLQIFKNNEFGELRVVEINNEGWIVGKDVTEKLGYQNGSRDINRHVDEEDRQIIKIHDGYQLRDMIIINESGLYALVLGSELPNARRFRRWVTNEVLPTIRKHGAYLTDEKIEEVLTDPDTIIKLATQLKEERSRRLEAERFNKQIAISENSLLVREVAKIASKGNVSIGEKRLWNKLREWGLVFKNSTEPMQEYIDRGYFEVVEGTKDTYKGTFTYRTTRVTGKGQVYIIKRLLKEQEIA